ncbi:MAG: (2Fe-2S)-binding protein [Anaerolineales bacterium]|jgi:sarcosine oxidase subunit alpha
MAKRLKNDSRSLHSDRKNRVEATESNLNIRIDQKEFTVPAGSSVAAAVIASGIRIFRHTDDGEARSFFCGMGVCYECLLTINGSPHQRACMTLVEDGMQISTGLEQP